MVNDACMFMICSGSYELNVTSWVSFFYFLIISTAHSGGPVYCYWQNFFLQQMVKYLNFIRTTKLFLNISSETYWSWKLLTPARWSKHPSGVIAVYLCLCVIIVIMVCQKNQYLLRYCPPVSMLRHVNACSARTGRFVQDTGRQRHTAISTNWAVRCTLQFCIGNDAPSTSRFTELCPSLQVLNISKRLQLWRNR